MAIDTSMQINGLASGMDTEQMVRDLMKAHQIRVDRVQQQRQVLDWRRDSYREINTKLLALRNAAFDMTLPGSFQSKKINSSDETVLTASAGTAAVAGNYTVNVVDLATGVNKGSSAAISSGDKANLASQLGLSGTLQFSLTGYNGSQEISQEFSFDTATQSIDDLVKAINQAGLGIQASYDSSVDRFFLSSRGTGKDYKIVASGTDAANLFNDKLKLDLNLTDGDKGSNAKIDFNGATGLEFSSNQFTLSGINFNLKKAGTTASITVSNDYDAVINKIKAFVESYNATMDLMGGKISEKKYRDFRPLTVEQKKDMKENDIKLWEDKAKSGLLTGDSLTRDVYNKMRSSVMGAVTGLPAGSKYSSLSSIGITTGLWQNSGRQNNGKWEDSGRLEINEDKLREALSADPEGVMRLFTQKGANDSPQGVAAQLHENIKTSISSLMTKAGNSSGNYDDSVMGKQISEVDKQINAMQLRLQSVESRYWKQFNAMEKALQRMNVQSAWLTQQASNNS